MSDSDRLQEVLENKKEAVGLDGQTVGRTGVIKERAEYVMAVSF